MSVLTYGMMFGLGCGLAYPIPVTCAMKVGFGPVIISPTHLPLDIFKKLDLIFLPILV